MNKIRYILAVLYVVGILYGCHKSGVAPASAENEKGSVSVIMKASPAGTYDDPNFIPPQPSSAKNSTIIVGPSFSHYNAVNVFISKVMIHSVTKGWIDLDTHFGTYDLMKLRSDVGATLVEKAELTAGSFDKIALTIGDANSIVIDSDKYILKTDVSLDPKVGVNAEILEGKNTEITLDFNAYTSISCVDYGCFVLNPVVAVKAVSVN
jgi:hypothetical protein